MDEEFDICRFGRDLTAEARAGKLPPIIGREEIIARVMEVLARATKNNPILVGEPGVGKTAIVEGLGLVMISEKCPSWLRGKRLISLEMAALIAGTRARGDFETRLKQVADFLRESSGSVIMFFDEIHQLVNLGRSEGSVDAANFFKPMLARGQIHCIGATTFEEYRQIEKDAALARRYIMVRVDEPEDQETLSILRGLRERFETHHNVRIQEGALSAAIELTNRYVTDRRQPDKSIDVLDEACAYLKAIGELPPAQMRELETIINQHRIKENALRREGGEELARVRSDLKRSERELKSSIELWKEQIENRRKYAALLKQRDECIVQIDTAQGCFDLKKTVSLKIDVLAPINEQLTKLERSVTQHVLDASIVAEVVARMTRIKSAGMAADARVRLNSLEQTLLSKWPHQSEAIRKVRDGLARTFAGLSEAHKPLLNAFIQVAKDELVIEFARSVANELCDGSLIAVDMREYSDKSSITKLIGAPPAYTGYESPTHLLEKVRQRPYCVILFRNMEHGHEEVTRLVMSIIDDGTLSDGMGRPVTFRHSIVFLAAAQADDWGCDMQIEMRNPGVEDRTSVIQVWMSELQNKLSPRATIEILPDALEMLTNSRLDRLAALNQYFRERVEVPIANMLLEDPCRRFVVVVDQDGQNVCVDAIK